MAEDPKSVLARAKAKMAADAEAARKREIAYKVAKKKAEYEEITRDALELGPDDPLPPETEQSEWVRENMTWERSLEFWEPPHCSYSDYSGGFVEKSNCRSLVRDFPEIFTESGGGHGWAACGITEEKRLALTVEEWESIKDAVEGLEDYPLYDEQDHSELEYEGKMEYWEEYGRPGVREALIKKFENDVDAQIAAIARPNEFWDTMARERDWDQHINEETGCNFYMREEDVVRNVGRDEFVNEDLVAEVKKKLFMSQVGKLEAALQREGIDYNDAEHLWQMFEYAEQHHEYSLWDVETRIHSGKEEVDPADYITLDVEESVKALAAPELHQRLLRKHWAEDPRQLKMPGFENKASDLAAAILDGEDPKSVLRAAIDSEGSQVVGYVIRWLGQDRFPEINKLQAASPEEAVRSLKRAHKGVRKILSVTPWVRSQQRADAKRRTFQFVNPNVVEGEDPKNFLQQLAPKGVPRRYIGNMPKKVEIWGKRWFARTYGNTYFTARIYVNDELVHTMPMEYGYGDHYMHQSFEWLEENGYIPQRPRIEARMGSYKESPWRWAEMNGFQLLYHAEDVRRRRDLFHESEDPRSVLRSAGEAHNAAKLQQLKVGSRVRIYHSVPNVVAYGDTGTVYEFPFGGEPDWANVELDHPQDENTYPFVVTELELI